jgi:3-oxoacyl-[acyl-carrier-protein] synthase III
VRNLKIWRLGILANEKISVGILGLGSCVPSKILTNQDLEKIVDTSDEWILKRTGISQRRILEESEPAYTLGVEAAKKAIEDAEIMAEDIDLIIVTTESPDSLSPSISCTIQDKIGANNAAAFDINAACTGFIYGMVIAQQFIQNGVYKHVLVVGCEGLSRIVDWKDRATCVLFGDGAGAVVLGKVEEGYGIISSKIASEGALGHNITIPCCYIDEVEKEKRVSGSTNTIWMDGGEVFKFAVKAMVQATETVLGLAGLSYGEINYVIPHQANSRIIDGAAKRMDVGPSKIIRNVEKYGNISSASIPVALDECIRNRMINKGDNIVFVAFGGGLTWGALIIKWSKCSE